jgi:hypothetical protein
LVVVLRDLEIVVERTRRRSRDPVIAVLRARHRIMKTRDGAVHENARGRPLFYVAAAAVTISYSNNSRHREFSVQYLVDR